MIETTYDLDDVKGRGAILGQPCPTEQWRSSISVRQDGNGWLLLIALEVPQGTFHYRVRAQISGDGEKLLVSPLCADQGMPFSGAETYFSLRRKDNLPRKLSLSLTNPSNGVERTAIFTQR